MRRVAASAPTRIDLAGGTIDLWPLSLLHDAPLTVNVAINRCARAWIEPIPSVGIEVVSRDRGGRAWLDPADPDVLDRTRTAIAAMIGAGDFDSVPPAD